MNRVPRINNPGAKKILIRTVVVLAMALAAMQLVPATMKTAQVPPNTLPVHVSEVVDAEVGKILDRSCGDCHTNDTSWPWYSTLPPVSWLVNRDVNKGRDKLNFSSWVQQRPSANQLSEVCDAVSEGSMPLFAYTLVHPRAKLSKQDVNSICNWADGGVAKHAGQ